MRRPGYDPDQEAEDRSARDRRNRLAPFLAARPQLAQARAHHVAGHLAARRRQDLAQPEQADRDRDDAEAVAKLRDIEAVAEVTGHHVDADGAEQEPEGRHQQGARERRRRHVGEEDQAEHEQRGVFRRPEPQREDGERRRDQGQHDHAERAGDERADRRDAQRGARASLARHGVAVDAGHHRGGFARDAQQDRRGRSAVLRAVVDAGQHHDRLGGVEPEGDRQQDADAGERADAGQHPDQRPDQAPQEGVPEHVGPEGDREAEQQAVEGGVHERYSQNRPRSSGALRAFPNNQ
jgi:hypothetical protein